MFRVLKAMVVTLASLSILATSCTIDSGESSLEEETYLTAGPMGYAALIRRTSDGVPHVLAEDLPGAVFGQGYASAEDHPCDLVDQIIMINSGRSAIFGPGDDDENLDTDFGWAALGLVNLAADDFKASSDEDKKLYEAFAAGWNTRFDQVGTDGIEDWCTGAEWMSNVTAEQIYAYGRSIMLLASSGRFIDYIGQAQPPGAESSQTETTDEVAFAAALKTSDNSESLGSNGWALGPERSESGNAMLVGNPHFPWIGQLRFSEIQLTTEDGIDVYGAQLLGVPLLGIGFNDDVAWTYTVSAGSRFTAYDMELAPDDPTSYVKDGEVIPMESREITIEVADGDSTEEKTRTYYSTEYGPVLNFPGLGWTDAQTISYRDANIANTEFPRQLQAMAESDSLQDLIDANQTYQGVPVFNTIAAGADGGTWYADTSATPNLSEESLSAYAARLETDVITKAAAESRAILLQGNTSRDDWVDDPAAPWPGILPWSELPMIERSDYVMNANDSYWVPNSEELIEGAFSPLQGLAGTARSVRTLQNFAVLDDTSKDGPAGEDGLFSLQELAAASLLDGAYYETQWRKGVVEHCEAADGSVESKELKSAKNGIFLKASDVDLTDSCKVLDEWDGSYDVGSSGAVLWREFIEQVTPNKLWKNQFDPEEPASTPSGLGNPVIDGEDEVLPALASAVALLEDLDIDIDASLGDLQYDARNPEDRIGLPGGLGSEGVTNVIANGADSSETMQVQPENPKPLVKGSTITEDGYPISYGTSILLIVDFAEDGPSAKSILTYGQVGDRENPEFTTQTLDFAAKQLKDVLFTQDAIKGDVGLEEVRVSA